MQNTPEADEREQIRREVFAEVAAGLNNVADIWERDGSDPCRVRITREYANAHRVYAEGYGEPCGSRKRRGARGEVTP